MKSCNNICGKEEWIRHQIVHPNLDMNVSGLDHLKQLFNRSVSMLNAEQKLLILQ